MTADVVYGNERYIEGIRQPLGKGQPDEERALQPRTVCNGDGIDIVNHNTRLR